MRFNCTFYSFGQDNVNSVAWSADHQGMKSKAFLVLLGLALCLLGGFVGGCSSDSASDKAAEPAEPESSPAMKSLEQAEKDSKMAADRKAETDEASTEGK